MPRTNIFYLDNLVSVSGEYTANANDEVIEWTDTSPGSITLLPKDQHRSEAVSISNSTLVELTVNPASGETIRGFDSVKFADGTLTLYQKDGGWGIR